MLHILPSERQPDDIMEVNKMELIPGGKYAYPYLVGCKTGYTDVARSTLVSCAEKRRHEADLCGHERRKSELL